ncbi:MAG: ABC transporter ATP-binding protein [Gammaproteobacteria bacterium]|nr:ABC transporter ATP-binding protein [Gammaproteobacteria bacterium]
MRTLLRCEDLSVRFNVRGGVIDAVSNVNLTVNRGECLGVLGESGSGKSQCFLAVMGLLSRNGSASGSVWFDGREILNAPRKELDRIRGRSIAMVFQDAMSGLTPFMRIGDQLTEVLVEHMGISEQDARKRSVEVLEILQLPQPRRRLRMYPYELSGGMRQRAMIALALLCKPELIIADEPTTALDATIQAQVLEFLGGLKRRTDTSIVIITHDFGVALELCDRVMVMYAGRVVECGLIGDIVSRPQHPYTQALFQATLGIDADPESDIPTIPGQAPDLQRLATGCAFAPRCSQAIPRCHQSRPELKKSFDGHMAACFVEQRR